MSESDFEAETTERCPICDSRNNPGAAIYCAHFQGMVWDGEVIWSDEYEAFDSVWSKFCELREQIEEANGEAGLDKLLSQLRKAKIPNLHKGKIPTPFIDCGNWYDYSARSALEQLVDFSCGEIIETDGMLSGSGYSLYHENSDIIGEVVFIYERMIDIAQPIIDQLTKKK